MKNEHSLIDAGYYEVTLRMRSGGWILRSNNERAFVMTQFQDLLGRRSLLEEPGNRYRLASHIDLLAFSITSKDIKVIAFSIAQSSIGAFAKIIVHRLQNYQSEWHVAPSFNAQQADDARISIVKLSGPYEALNNSVLLHLRHSDWEYDRYSSIGFYLHDRRGDWMHLWRLSRLYENDQELYRALVMRELAPRKKWPRFSITRPFAPLLHG